jgi:hypothetical protein
MSDAHGLEQTLQQDSRPPATPSLPLCLALLEEKGKTATGLTPSYLIGAQLHDLSTVLDADTAYRELCSLLEAFSAAPQGYHVVISRCTVHGQPIAALYRMKAGRPFGEAILDHHGTATPLHADRGYFATKQTTLNSLTAGLWRSFQGPLTAAEYSYRDKTYCAFDDTEQIAISRVKERLAHARL